MRVQIYHGWGRFINTVVIFESGGAVTLTLTLHLTLYLTLILTLTLTLTLT